MTNKIVAGVGVALTLILTGAGCSSSTTTSNSNTTVQSNTFSKEAMVGTWKGDVAAFGEITLKDDGTFTSQEGGKEWSKGTWKVDGTSLVLEDPEGFILNETIENAQISGDTFTGVNKGDTGPAVDEKWIRVK